MKKFTLFAIALLASVVSFALNPFAYGLSSNLSDNGLTLTVNYSLNADATSVNVVILNGEDVVATLPSDGTTKGDHSMQVSAIDLPKNVSLTWKVEVNGNSVDKPTQEATAYSLYCPHGLAIDKDPESEYFGRILVADAMNIVKDKTGYLGSGIGAGLHVFNPSFTTDSVVYTGGNNFTRLWASNGYQPWRVKISEDGRIFVSSQDINGVVVWEVSKDLQTWTPVIAGTNNATDYNIYDAKSNFVAGLNVSMDVKGSGEDLTLLLYSCTKSAPSAVQSAFRLDEYALGTATTWTGTPKNILKGGKYAVLPVNAEWIYDGEGGYWFGASRGGNAGQPNLVHINAEGVEDYRDETSTYYGGDGVLLHKGMLIKGRQTTVDFITLGKDADGKPTLTSKWNITADKIGRNKNEFAVDYADNLYVVGNSGEKIIAYALPYSGQVVTPAASKYAFQVGSVQYTITATVNDETMGTVSGARKYYKGETVTLKATPKTGYEFVNWSNGSTANPLVFAATENVELTANFKVLQYTVTVGVNDETKGSVTNAGEHTLDYGTELVLEATPNAGYRFVKWSTGATANPLTITVSGDLEITALFENANITARAWAYDLSLETADDTYTLSFKATTPADATIIFTNAEGEEVGTHELGAIAAGANKISLTTDQLPEVSELYWAVKMAYDDVIAIREVTDQSRGIYNFYLPQGVVVDNNPESPTFSKIYIAEATDGASDGGSVRADNQKRGIFIYDQTLAELNPTSNVGIIPSNVTLSTTTRNALKRIAINPKTNEVAFAYNASPAAVWAVSTENVAGDATNLLAGLGFDYCNSLCFDENGILYIFDNGAGYPAKGSLYKIVDGEKTTIFSENSKYGNADNSLASDGRGGLWIAQNRSQLDAFNQLAHVNANGQIDFEVNTTTPHGFASLDLSRGAMAYNPRENVLAIGCGASGTIGVSLYHVTYDPSTGVPSLEFIASTPSLGKNVDGIAFDYAGDLYALSANKERFYKFTLPTNNNTCTTPAPKSQVITKPSNPTVLDNTVVAPQVQKIVRDGQVLIIRDGKTFNMMGQEVR